MFVSYQTSAVGGKINAQLSVKGRKYVCVSYCLFVFFRADCMCVILHHKCVFVWIIASLLKTTFSLNGSTFVKNSDHPSLPDGAETHSAKLFVCRWLLELELSLCVSVCVCVCVGVGV